MGGCWAARRILADRKDKSGYVALAVGITGEPASVVGLATDFVRAIALCGCS